MYEMFWTEGTLCLKQISLFYQSTAHIGLNDMGRRNHVNIIKKQSGKQDKYGKMQDHDWTQITRMSWNLQVSNTVEYKSKFNITNLAS